MSEAKLPPIEIGFQVFLHDGDEEFGAVRDVAPGGRPELIVYVENAGDFPVPLTAVTAVHSQKVVVNAKALPKALLAAIGHAHEAERF